MTSNHPMNTNTKQMLHSYKTQRHKTLLTLSLLKKINIVSQLDMTDMSNGKQKAATIVIEELASSTFMTD
jgi:hypothetical protein